jgi:DNA invertase Pin-like site-specific DNA recombinase
VSTAEQAAGGASLKAQRAALQLEAERRGWNLVRTYSDTASGKTVTGRPGLAEALHALEGRNAEALIVAKLDRLSRSIVDFGSLMERARQEGWALVALDLGVDTTTPSGELVANVMASVAQWERRAIGQRTKDALAAKREQGVRLGRPPALPVAVLSHMARLRARGMTYQAIADTLVSERVPTAHGGATWHAATVRKALASTTARR